MPASAYIRFSRDNMEKLKAEHPDMTQTNLITIIGRIWSNLDDEHKEEYKEAERKDRLVYNEKLEKFYLKYPEERPKKSSKNK